METFSAMFMGECGLSHGGAARDDDEVGGLEAAGHLVEAFVVCFGPVMAGRAGAGIDGAEALADDLLNTVKPRPIRCSEI